MTFRKYFNESKEKELEKILKEVLNENYKVYESSCLEKIKKAIQEFIEIAEFKPIIDKRKIGITINGEFRGGEKGSKHLELKCTGMDINKIINGLNKNIDRINKNL